MSASRYNKLMTAKLFLQENQMALTLCHNDRSVCAQKVRLALAERSLAYEARHLNLRASTASFQARLSDKRCSAI